MWNRARRRAGTSALPACRIWLGPLSILPSSSSITSFDGQPQLPSLMLRIPGQPGRDLCDSHLGITRRDLVRIGGSAIMGLSLGSIFGLRARAAEAAKGGGPGWGKAKSVVMVY